MSAKESATPLTPTRLPKPPTRKWVTFDDLIDDALESGKLSPRKGKAVNLTASKSTDFVKKTSSSSSSSSVLATQEDERPKPLRRSSLAHVDSRTSEPPGKDPLDFSQSLEDKYSSAFADMRGRSLAYTGWSGRVLAGSGPFGWSDEVLEYEHVSSEEECTDKKMHEDETSSPSWKTALKTATWDTSPSRTFVRNFP